MRNTKKNLAIIFNIIFLLSISGCFETSTSDTVKARSLILKLTAEKNLLQIDEEEEIFIKIKVNDNDGNPVTIEVVDYYANNIKIASTSAGAIGFKPNQPGKYIINAKIGEFSSNFLTIEALKRDIKVPTFNIPSGKYNTDQTIVLKCDTTGTSIYYTIDETDPTNTSGLLYQNPIVISKTTVIKAVSYFGNKSKSDISVARIEISKVMEKVTEKAVPNIKSGTYTTSQTITLSGAKSNQKVFYTIDGSDPTEKTGIEYKSVPIVIKNSTTLKTRVFMENWEPGDILETVYTIKLPKLSPPIAELKEGKYTTAQSFKFIDLKEGESVIYTIDGSEPELSKGKIYKEAFIIDKNITIRAKSYREGYEASDTASYSYTFYTEGKKVENPELSIASGTYVKEITVSIRTNTTGAMIRYNLGESGDSKIYSEPIVIKSTSRLVTIASKEGWESSDIIIAEYIIVEEQMKIAFDKTNSVVNEGEEIKITAPSNVKVYYTLDGSKPDISSMLYSGSIILEKSSTINAVACLDGNIASDIITKRFDVKTNVPVVTPISGTYPEKTKVSISGGGNIYYTLDNSIPTKDSLLYTQELEVEKNLILKAVAIKDGCIASEVVENIYTVVDKTPPIGSIENQIVSAGAIVIVRSTERGYAYLIPATTTPDLIDTKEKLDGMIGEAGVRGEITAVNEDTMIVAPRLDGDYKLVVIDNAGNISEMGVNILSVNSVALEGRILSLSSVSGAAIVTIQSTKSGYGYLIPAETEIESRDTKAKLDALLGDKATMVEISLAGKNTLIPAPVAEGIYNLVVVDIAGNVSGMSAGSITVDRTKPTGKVESQTVSGGGLVMVQSTEPGYAYLIPENTAADLIDTKLKLDAMLGSKATRSQIIKADQNTAMLAPSKEGVYKLLVLDISGNISEISENSITVDNTAPTGIVSEQTVLRGANITVQSSKAGYAYLISENTVAGSRNTKAKLDALLGVKATRVEIVTPNTDTIIAVPESEGIYKLVVADNIGNVSGLSVNSIIVDNTAPKGELSVQTISGGKGVTIQSSEPGFGYLIPSNTAADLRDTKAKLDAMLGLSATRAEINAANQNTTILAPKTEGSYKLVVTDKIGNVSAMSTNSINVDNTAPVGIIATQTVSGGAIVMLQSSKVGYGYLIPSTTAAESIDTKAKLDAMLGSSATRVEIITANQYTLLRTPITAGIYKLVVVDNIGNISAMSTNSITIDNSPLTGTTASQRVSGGASVEVQSNRTGYGYLVPSTTAVELRDTKAKLDAMLGTTATRVKIVTAYKNTTMVAPMIEGTYKLVVVDDIDNISGMSLNSIIVDNKAPTGKLTTQTASGGGIVFVQSTETGYGYLIPSNTATTSRNTKEKLDAIVGATATKIEITTENQNTAILAPITEGEYRLIVVDIAGNISGMSTNTVMVDNRAPIGIVNQQTVIGGKEVYIQSSETGYGYLIPSATPLELRNTKAKLDALLLTPTTATMAQITTVYQSTPILSPKTEGIYKLVVVDIVGNVSNISENNITVDNIPFIGTVVEQTVLGGANISVQSSKLGYAYLIPSNTLSSLRDTKGKLELMVGISATKAEITTANQNTTMSAPLTDGIYRLVVVDNLGNVSGMSDNSVTVDNTPPVGIISSQTVSTGAAITIQSSEAGYGYLIPSNTLALFRDTKAKLDAMVGATATKVQITTAYKNTTIYAPAVDGTYKLIVSDNIGNISEMSSNSVIVDSEIPSGTIASQTVTTGGIVMVQSSKIGYAYLIPASTPLSYRDTREKLDAMVGITATRVQISVANQNTIITVPGADGTYKLVVADNAGNVSNVSQNTVTVDNTPPVGIVSAQIVSGGNPVTIKSSETGYAYLIPSTTVNNMRESKAKLDTLLGVSATNVQIVTANQNTTIAAPLTEGTYNLVVLDSMGNVSSMSVNSVTVDNSPPTGTMLTQIGKAGSNITIQSTEVGYGYLISSNTATSSRDTKAKLDALLGVAATRIQITSANMNTIIIAPAADGIYKLVVVDNAGNVSGMSVNSVTIDSTAPIGAIATQMVLSAGSLVIQSSEPGYGYLIPTNTVIDSRNTKEKLDALVGTTATRVQILTANQNTTIIAPVTEGIYKLVVVDNIGNVSGMSSNSVTVDSTAPTGTVAPLTVSAGGDVVIQSSETGYGYLILATTLLNSRDTKAKLDALLGATATRVQITGANQNTTIPAPVTAGTYKLVVVDTLGNISNLSTNSVVVDTTPPSGVVAGQLVSGGAIVIIQSTETGYGYLIPTNIDSTLRNTKAKLDVMLGATATRTIITTANQNTTIIAPAASGTYNLVVTDSAGNVSGMSLNSVTVDSTAPIGTIANQVVAGGTAVTFQSTEQGYGYLISSSIAAVSRDTKLKLDLMLGASATRVQITTPNQNMTIPAPVSDGIYKLIIVDNVGNLSNISTNSVMVDSIVPVGTIANQIVSGGTNITFQSNESGYGYLIQNNIAANLRDTKAELDLLLGGTATRAQITSINANTTISVPAVDGIYKLVVVDNVGNVSDVSTNSVTVESTIPVGTVALQTVSSGSGITIQSTEIGYGYLIPSNTLLTSRDTKAKLDALLGITATRVQINLPNQNTTIMPPVVDGIYRLVVVDLAGNISNISVNSVTVDNLAPSGTIATQIVSGGTSVTMQSSEPGFGYLIPANTLIDSRDTKAKLDVMLGGSATMVQIAVANQNTLISTPLAEGLYKLVVIDNIGNVSNMSTTTITVDNTAPTPTVANQILSGGTDVIIQSNEIGYGYLISANVGVTLRNTKAKLDALLGATATRTQITTVTTGTTIAVPATEGSYKLVAVDIAGNVSDVTINSITVDNTAPTGTVANQSIMGGTGIIIQSTEIGYGYLIPSGTLLLSMNTKAKLDAMPAATATKVQITIGNQDTTILSPATSGTYKLVVVDTAGNISGMSANTITVDNTPPTGVITTQVVAGGANVTVQSSEIGYAYLIPENIPVDSRNTKAKLDVMTGANATSVQITVANFNTTILAPANSGNYVLVVVDVAGNVSGISTNKVTVN